MAGWTKGKPKSVDDYLAKLDPERRLALEKLRRQILSVVPDAEPCISYSMPAFRVGGKVVAGFLGASHGCSYYPFSGQTLGTLAAELAGYEQTKSALHFDTRRGLPLALVRKLLRARIAETQSQASPRRVKKPARRLTKRR
jgi:uncharacterized protein YdhG (YjbR/CyaY superfamily)